MGREVLSWLQELFGEWSGYKQLYEHEKQKVGELTDNVEELSVQITNLQEIITPPSPPTVYGKISNQDIRQLFLELFPECDRCIFLGDIHYDLVTIAEIRRFANWSKVNLLRYIADTENMSSHDCDRFAVGLVGQFANSLGWCDVPFYQIWGNLYGGHAFCAMVAKPEPNDDPRIYFLEPQTDIEIAREMVAEMELWLVA